MKNEIEARLLECNEEEFIAKLESKGAKFVGEWLQIRNCYDFNPIKENSWIRLRTNGIETTLTIKEIQNKKIDGTKELEIVVSDFEETDAILNKLGYVARSHQENKRIRYMLDSVEIDIDSWPMIPTYVEFEADSKEAIFNVCKKLDINIDDLTTLDVCGIYNHYGLDIASKSDIKLEDNRRIINRR